MRTPSTPDRRADRLAVLQLALITWAQAIGVGLTRDQILHRQSSGRWIRLAPGVYRVAGAPVTWQQQILAACLAGGQATVASHLSAAALWGLAEPPARPHVTRPREVSSRSRLATVHRSRLADRDFTRVGPVPVTRVERTLVDCAVLLPRSALEDLVDEAVVRGLATPDGIGAANARAGRAPGRAGSRALVDALSVWAPGIRPDSTAEMRLLRQIREWGMPAPTPQFEVKDTTGRVLAHLDLAWPVARVGLEYDSDRWHAPRRWDHDEARHAGVERLGWRIRHVDTTDLRAGRDDLRRMLTTLLASTEAA